MTVIEDEVRRIIEQRDLPPGDAITDVLEGPNVIVMTSKRGVEWRVEPVPRVGGHPRSGGYSLYFFVGTFTLWRDFVAALPDGRTFVLNKVDEFRSFLRAAHTILPPLELAGHVTNWLSNGRHENVIWTMAEPAPMLTEQQVKALPITLPEAHTRDDGSVSLAYCTFYVDESSRPYWTISLNRWRVELSPEGELTHEIEPLARRVESAFYAPK